MFDSDDEVDGLHERAPQAPLVREHFFAGRSQAIEPPATFASLFRPATRNPSALFEAVQEWIERGRVERDRAARTLFDALRNVIPMARTGLDGRQDQQLSAALLHF